MVVLYDKAYADIRAQQSRTLSLIGGACEHTRRIMMDAASTAREDGRQLAGMPARVLDKAKVVSQLS